MEKAAFCWFPVLRTDGAVWSIWEAARDSEKALGLTFKVGCAVHQDGLLVVSLGVYTETNQLLRQSFQHRMLIEQAKQQLLLGDAIPATERQIVPARSACCYRLFGVEALEEILPFGTLTSWCGGQMIYDPTKDGVTITGASNALGAVPLELAEKIEPHLNALFREFSLTN